MQFPLLLVAGLLAATASPTSRVKVASPGLAGYQLDATAAAFYGDHLAHQLNANGLEVVTAKEIEAVLGLERQKQLLGCPTDSTRCLVELANALGVDAVLMGNLAKVGTFFQLDVKILRAADASSVSSYSAKLPSEEALLEAVASAARSMAPEVKRGFGRDASPVVSRPAESAPPRGGLRKWAWAPAAVGVVAAGLGTFELLQAKASFDLLHPSSPISYPDAQRHVAEGRAANDLARLAFGVGAAAFGVGVAFYLLDGSSPAAVSASIAVAPGEAALVFSGALP